MNIVLLPSIICVWFLFSTERSQCIVAVKCIPRRTLIPETKLPAVLDKHNSFPQLLYSHTALSVFCQPAGITARLLTILIPFSNTSRTTIPPLSPGFDLFYTPSVNSEYKYVQYLWGCKMQFPTFPLRSSPVYVSDELT